MSFEADYKLKRVEFPEPAGTYQREGRDTALIRELGTNYATYHAFLRTRLESFGERPQAKNFRSKEEFYDTWAKIQELMRAEALLRACRLFILEGRRLDSPLDPRIPFLDANDRLVSAE